jgi:hypothetical protein
MALTGKIASRDGKLYVLYSTTEDSTPTRVNLWWRVLETHRNPYNANRPSAGDTATGSGGGSWSTHGSNGPSGGVSCGDGRAQAEFVEREPIHPPKSGGKELRWKYGQWEKLTAKGWIPAGEGKAPTAKTPRKKSAAHLQREIDAALTEKL